MRRIVIIAGLSAIVVGFGMIVTLPIPTLWRAFGAVLWLLLGMREMHIITSGYKRCQQLRIQHNGDVLVTAPDGCCMPATLCAGSIVLARLAWLRFRTDDGQHFVELVRGGSSKNKDWRRLQVIWRHLGAGR